MVRGFIPLLPPPGGCGGQGGICLSPPCAFSQPHGCFYTCYPALNGDGRSKRHRMDHRRSRKTKWTPCSRQLRAERGSLSHHDGVERCYVSALTEHRENARSTAASAPHRSSPHLTDCDETPNPDLLQPLTAQGLKTRSSEGLRCAVVVKAEGGEDLRFPPICWSILCSDKAEQFPPFAGRY